MSEQPVQLPHRGLLVVFDGAKVLILRNTGMERTPQLELVEAMQQSAPRTYEIGHDRPGRVHQSLGASRSAEEGRDLHLAKKLSFMRDIAAAITRAVGDSATTTLVLAAPPRLIEELRQALASPIRKLIVAEIGKDLTKLPILQIERHLVA